jgi:hypothetical protein
MNGRSGKLSVGVWLICIGFLVPVVAQEAEVAAVARSLQIDGVLVEWGLPQGVAIDPGGDGVGLRGAFDGPEDHEVDLYLMWDVDFLYVAVAVVDDVLDVDRIGAGDNVWKGPGGERKDAMFYFDHLKVFLRDPDMPLGHNVWVGPTDGEREPYVWGGRQRNKPTADVPVRVGSARKGEIYTYELAFPWKWLGIYPEEGMELDAMFLLPDSDLPGLEMRKKVRKSNKWIWWKGKARLLGEPPGWKPRPPPVVLEEIQKQTQAIVLPELKPKERPPEEKPAPETAVGPAESSEVKAEDGAGEMPESEGTGEQQQVGAVADGSTTPSVAALRARLNRQRLARSHVRGAPEWVRGLGKDQGLSSPVVDSLYYRLTVTLHRLTESEINSRTDGLVMEIAEYAGTWRAQARGFLVSLLDRVSVDLQEEGALRDGIAAAAAQVGVEEEQGMILVEEVCSETLTLYREGKVSTTGELLEKARRRARFSAEEARAFTRALAGDWGE